MTFRRAYDAFDRCQQRRAWLGFPLAVRQKYADDQGGYLAATITYYGFFAVFPLLLVLVSVLGFVLKGHPELQKRIVDSALGQFPVIGRGLKVGALHGSTAALVLGIDSDRLFPIDGQHRIARGIRNTLDGDRAVVLTSDFGHDGFLIETHAVGMHLRRLLAA